MIVSMSEYVFYSILMENADNPIQVLDLIDKLRICLIILIDEIKHSWLIYTWEYRIT